MVAIYIQIYCLARYHARQIKATQAHEIANGSSHHKPGENKALHTLGMIMGLFLVSWIPFFVINLVNSGCNCVPGKLFVTATWLGYVNSTMNPIIYSKFNADFRAAFKRILLCKRCRKKRDPYDFKPRSRVSSASEQKKLSRFGNSVTNGTNVISLLPSNSNSNNNQSESKFEMQSLLANDGNSEYVDNRKSVITAEEKLSD